MGAGGFILSMIASLKSNERQKRKALSSLGRERSILGRSQRLKYKEVNEEELNSIKWKIRTRSLHEKKRRTILLFSLLSLIIISFAIILKLWLADVVQQRIYVTNKNYNRVRDSINQISDSLYFKYLNEGFDRLSRKNYTEAKESLYEAYQTKPTEFEGIYLYTKACVLECKSKGVYCESAHKSLEFLKYKYPNNEEVKLLIEIYGK